MASKHSPNTPPTTNLGGSATRYRKSRGRPKKDSERDTSADRRRARGRIAQDAFRRRKQALTTSMKQKNLALVNIIEQMSTGFTDFADELLRSEHFRNDRALTYHLSHATRRFVELARMASQSPVPGSGPAEESFSNIPAANALLPQGHTRWAPAEAILPAGASSLTWQSHQPIPTFHDMVFVSHDPLRDEQALGASSLTQPLGAFPMTSPPFSVESAAVRYPFGSRLLLYTLEFVYFSLLGRDNYTPHLAIQIFRLTLAEHTRPQILSAIRWYLGPGSRGLPESVPVVESSLDPINSRETWTFGDAIFPVRQGRERDQYLSAYEIEEYLKTRAISEMDVDTLRIKIKSPNHLPASRCHENLTPSSFDSSPDYAVIKKDVLEKAFQTPDPRNHSRIWLLRLI
ncbi:uncharacterized protein N7458_000022 [Penicillium daleae]|uniref:BZIP domain-containing protein n=1 Tax=Penicillium daleae TaxID=63821 RepID=A0AAD6G8D6_9EURO|nr:uncharacterized protein N7458_000022 [Penicillium daleae]KAJ5464336.1 hypothetical protein N7458_000022 [Penicillium daleae]